MIGRIGYDERGAGAQRARSGSVGSDGSVGSVGSFGKAEDVKRKRENVGMQERGEEEEVRDSKKPPRAPGSWEKEESEWREDMRRGSR